MNSLTCGVKSWDNVCWNRHCARGGLQYSMSRVELDLLFTAFSAETVG